MLTKFCFKKKPYATKKSIKHFIGYNDDDVKLPQMIGYVKCLDSNKTTSFQVTDDKLLKNYTKIWEKVSNLMDIKFDSEPVYGDNDKYIKTKIRIYRDKVNTNFQGKKCAKRKCIIPMFVINNVRFCYQSEQKVLPSNTLGRM